MTVRKFKYNLSDLINKKGVISIIISIILLIFLIPLKNYYDEKVVKPLLSEIPSNVLIAVIFCISCLLSLILFYYALTTNKKVSNWMFFISVFWFSLFIYYRLSGDYLFSPYTGRNGVKYFDFCFIAFGAFGFLKVKCWIISEKPPRYFQQPFQMDIPIKESSEDLYKRKEFAFELAVKIQSKLQQTNSGSLAIGINGEWGSGKTSFCHFIKEKIDIRNRVVIDFNPWRCSTPAKIIENFFELLIDEIRKFDPGLSAEVSKYAKTLAKINENVITQGIETISDFFFDEVNKNESYERLNKSIQSSKKQIIIFIDDLDRLDRREIIETLRLIRNTANFNNVVYIVSYDKGYVLDAVKSFNRHNHRNFLEKIFQFEFLLPKYEPAILRNEIKGTLKQKLGTTYDQSIDASVDYAGISGKNITGRVIKTQRDVIRFTNSLLFEMRRVKNEVNFIDFYFVQLLKIKFPGVYKFISDHNDLLFFKERKKLRLRATGEKNYNDEGISMLMLDEPRNDAKEARVEDTIFEEYIRKNTSNGLSAIEKDVIIDVMKELLKEKYLRKRSESIDYKSFVFVINFHKYFSIQLLETDFSSSEFENARFEDFGTYQKNVLEWIRQGRISDIQDRLEKIVDFESKEEWENHIKILATIGRYQNTSTEPLGVNYVQVLKTLNYPKSRNDLIFFNTEDEYKDYLTEFFRSAPDPYIFESNLLNASLRPYASINLPVGEVYDLLLEYFIKYCKDHKEITSEFRQLHRNCEKEREGYYDDYYIMPEAEELFKAHFKTYLTGDGLSGFIRHTNPRQEYFNMNEEWLLNIFKDLKEFESFLKESENIKVQKEHLDEFLDFYEKCKQNNHKPIEYHFKYLQPNRWT